MDNIPLLTVELLNKIAREEGFIRYKNKKKNKLIEILQDYFKKKNINEEYLNNKYFLKKDFENRLNLMNKNMVLKNSKKEEIKNKKSSMDIIKSTFKEINKENKRLKKIAKYYINDFKDISKIGDEELNLFINFINKEENLNENDMIILLKYLMIN